MKCPGIIADLRHSDSNEQVVRRPVQRGCECFAGHSNRLMSLQKAPGLMGCLRRGRRLRWCAGPAGRQLPTLCGSTAAGATGTRSRNSGSPATSPTTSSRTTGSSIHVTRPDAARPLVGQPERAHTQTGDAQPVWSRVARSRRPGERRKRDDGVVDALLGAAERLRVLLERVPPSDRAVREWLLGAGAWLRRSGRCRRRSRTRLLRLPRRGPRPGTRPGPRFPRCSRIVPGVLLRGSRRWSAWLLHV